MAKAGIGTFTLEVLLCGTGWIAQLHEAFPDKEAGHQETSRQKDIISDGAHRRFSS